MERSGELLLARAGFIPAPRAAHHGLTHGVRNAAFCEHMFLAREIGAELVEGRDVRSTRASAAQARAVTPEAQYPVPGLSCFDDRGEPSVLRPSLAGSSAVLSSASGCRPIRRGSPSTRSGPARRPSSAHRRSRAFGLHLRGHARRRVDHLGELLLRYPSPFPCRPHSVGLYGSVRATHRTMPTICASGGHGRVGQACLFRLSLCSSHPAVES